jgi:hypothetical protein
MGKQFYLDHERNLDLIFLANAGTGFCENSNERTGAAKGKEVRRWISKY